MFAFLKDIPAKEISAAEFAKKYMRPCPDCGLLCYEVHVICKAKAIIPVGEVA